MAKVGRLICYVFVIIAFCNVVSAAFRSQSQKQDAIRFLEDLLVERIYIPAAMMAVAGITLLIMYYPYAFYRSEMYTDHSMLAEKIRRYQKDIRELEPTIAILENKIAENKEECKQMIKTVEKSSADETQKVDDLMAKLDDIRKAVLIHKKGSEQITNAADALNCVRAVNTPHTGRGAYFRAMALAEAEAKKRQSKETK